MTPGCSGKPVERHRDGAGVTNPLIYVGMIASADTVMKSGENRDK